MVGERFDSSTLADGLSIRFVVTDGKATVPVAFTGMTPDLFREGSGVVAEGAFQPDGSFVATNILAKHDERYMPPQIAGKMHETDTLDPMIAEGGLAALWLAAAFALIQLVLAFSAANAPGEGEFFTATRRVAVIQGLLAALSFGLLILLFVRSDMSVKLVVENSHSAKPLLYKIAGAWGNHEGSMLLWVTMLALAGAGGGDVRTAARSAHAGGDARRAGRDRARLLRLPADRLEPVRPARSGARPRGRGSIRCSRTPASPSIRRRSTSAMSGCRSPSRSRSARW